MGTDQRLNNPISIPTREEPSRRKSDGAGIGWMGGDLTAGPIPGAELCWRTLDCASSPAFRRVAPQSLPSDHAVKYGVCCIHRVITAEPHFRPTR
jgi:hypothetical protein